MGTIILFYKYIDIQYPHSIMKWQRTLCTSLGLKGRILLATEGINGILGGETDRIELYKQAMNAHAYFADIDFKESDGSADCFPRLMVKVKKEIVKLGLDPQEVRARDAGISLSPEEAHALIEQNKDLVLLDTRNEYESRIGTFQNALVPNTTNFRDFPDYINKNLEQLQDKNVLMFCTGGIRCERASAYVKTKSIAKNVYHIRGGIHRYVEKFPNGYFKGKNYVFDGRIAVKVSDDVLAQCEHCKMTCDEYTNCINAECNKQIIVCPSCMPSYHNTCSTRCLDLVTRGLVKVRVLPKRVNQQSCII